MSEMSDISTIGDILGYIESDDDDSLFRPMRRNRKFKKRAASAKTTLKKPQIKQKKKGIKRKRKPKPKDMPRRPLSAYNIFFREQRALIIGTKPPDLKDLGSPKNEALPMDGSTPNFERKKRAHRKTHGKISFSNLAKEIGRSWNELPHDQRTRFVAGAAKEKERYQEELRVYRLRKKCEEKNEKIKQEDRDSCSNATQSDPKTLERRTVAGIPHKEDKDQSYGRLSSYENDRSHIDYAHDHIAIVSPSCQSDRKRGDSPYYSSLDNSQRLQPSLSGFESEYNSSRRTYDLADIRTDIATSDEPDLPDDTLTPLPIEYDAKHHKEEFISEQDMARFFSPLLSWKRPRPRRRCLPTSTSYADGKRHVIKSVNSISDFCDEDKKKCQASPYPYFPRNYDHEHHCECHHPAANVSRPDRDEVDYFPSSYLPAASLTEEKGHGQEHEHDQEQEEYYDISNVGVFSM